MREYLRDGFVGSLTSFFKCWIDGGRVLVALRVDRALASLAFGSVASASFSCSNLARRNAVD